MSSMDVARPNRSASRKTGSRSLAISPQARSTDAPISPGCFLLATAMYGSLYNTTLCGPLANHLVAIMRYSRLGLYQNMQAARESDMRKRVICRRQPDQNSSGPSGVADQSMLLKNCMCSLVGRSSTQLGRILA